MRRLIRAPLLAPVLLPLLAGCYVYRPVDTAASPSRDRVRFTLTDSGAVVLASQLGPATEEVSGWVVGDSGGAYVLSVLATRRRGGTDMDWKGERVALPRLLVARAEERRFSRRRTVLAGVGLVVAAVGARAAFWGPGGVFGGGQSGPGSPPR